MNAEIYLELQLLGKIIAAAILGGLVGLEREFAHKPAGLRTHMLVGATAAFFVVMGIRMLSSFELRNYMSADPVRIIEAVVVGISFLGAGTILKDVRGGNSHIEGLTTSASILSVAAIGIAVALDSYILAVGVTLWNLFINWGVSYLIHRAMGQNDRASD